MRILLASAAAAALMAGTAAAADLPAYEPAPMVAPVPQVFSWTGFYLGAQGGYTWGDAEVDIGAAGDGSFDADGWSVGAFAGYNYQFQNNVVVGAEADLEWTDIDGDDTVGAIDFGADINWQGSLRARLGYAFDRALLYATGGLAFADVDSECTCGAGGDSDVEWGWNLGAGVDYAVTDNVFLRGEYRYTDLSGLDGGAVGEAEDYDSHAVRLGVGVLF